MKANADFASAMRELGEQWPDGFVRLSTRTIDRLQVYSRRHIALNGARLREEREMATADMFRELSGYIWQEVLQDERVTLKLEASYPATWWQHFKRRWFRQWMLRRWPVKLNTIRKEETHQFKTVALFPEFKYEAPPSSGPYLIKTMVERRW